MSVGELPKRRNRRPETARDCLEPWTSGTRTCGVPCTVSRRPREPTHVHLSIGQLRWMSVDCIHIRATRRFCATLACAADKWRPLRLIQLHYTGNARFYVVADKPVLVNAVASLLCLQLGCLELIK